MVALLWRVTRFQGDRAFLPALHLLTGFGFLLMVSIRDPLRDTLEFRKFAWGVAAGCLALLLPLFRPLRLERLSHWCYTPLFLALGLLVLGTGLFSAMPNLAFGQDAVVLHVGTLIDAFGGAAREKRAGVLV